MMTRIIDEEVTALVHPSNNGRMVGKDDLVMVLPSMTPSTSTSSCSLSSLSGNHKRVSVTADDRQQSQLEVTAPGEALTTQPAQTEVHHHDQLQPSNAVKHQLSSHKKNGRKASHKLGRWSLDEKILFLYGLRKFGKGRWKKISVFLPDRYVRLSCLARKQAAALSTDECDWFGAVDCSTGWILTSQSIVASTGVHYLLY
jgi:hypothetical protein